MWPNGKDKKYELLEVEIRPNGTLQNLGCQEYVSYLITETKSSSASVEQNFISVIDVIAVESHCSNATLVNMGYLCVSFSRVISNLNARKDVFCWPWLNVLSLECWNCVRDQVFKRSGTWFYFCGVRNYRRSGVVCVGVRSVEGATCLHVTNHYSDSGLMALWLRRRPRISRGRVIRRRDHLSFSYRHLSVV